MNFFLFGIYPYIVFIVLVGGLIWRYRYDQFGWTTRSSQLYESKILKIASPTFHFALLAVLIGHLVGLLIPIAVTNWLGITQHMYHLGALFGGGAAGFILAISLAALIWRRRMTKRVFRATTRNDKFMYLVLAGAIVAGLAATFFGDIEPGGGDHNYRETVSVWFRSLFVFQPNVEAMDAATLVFKVHVLLGLSVFLIVPFTRLVHAFTAPFHYIFRPYTVYRTRDAATSPLKGVRRGWDPVGTTDKAKGRK